MATNLATGDGVQLQGVASSPTMIVESLDPALSAVDRARYRDQYGTEPPEPDPNDPVNVNCLWFDGVRVMRQKFLSTLLTKIS